MKKIPAVEISHFLAEYCRLGTPIVRILVAIDIISFDFISDASHDQTAKLRFFGTTVPPIPWEPSFCVLREDVKTLTFHKQEEVSSTLSSS